MSLKKSRVRPIPDFSKAHQLMEMQLAARKMEMKKCTKIEEFNLTKQGSRSDCNIDSCQETPRKNLGVSGITPVHLRVAVQQHAQNAISDLRPQIEKPAQELGIQKKCSGILKNAGPRGFEALTGQMAQVDNVVPLKRPRVTFSLDSPVKYSPRSAAKRVPVKIESPVRYSPRFAAKRIPGKVCSLSTPKISPVQSRTLYNYGRVPVEVPMSSRSEQHRAQRVPCSSGQALSASQSGSRIMDAGGMIRFKTDPIAKFIDFNEENETEGKPETAFQNTNPPTKKVSLLDKIHIDEESRSSAMFSPHPRASSNSVSMVLSPLSTKDLNRQKKVTKIPLFRRQGSGSLSLKTQMIEKENRLNIGFNELYETEEILVRKSIDKKLELRDDEVSHTYLNVQRQKVAELERKAQRLRRRSQLTDDQSEVDRILRKLESLEKTIKSMRFDLHSVRESASELAEDSSVGDQNFRAPDCSVPENESKSDAAVEENIEVPCSFNDVKALVFEQIAESLNVDAVEEISNSKAEHNDGDCVKIETKEMANEANEVSSDDISLPSSADSFEDKENMNPLAGEKQSGSFAFDFQLESDVSACQNLKLPSSKCLNFPAASGATTDGASASVITALSCERIVLKDITDMVKNCHEKVDNGDDDDNVFLVEDSCSDSERDPMSSPMTVSPAASAKKSDGWKNEFENGFNKELMEKLNLSARLDDTKDELTESPNVSSEFVNYRSYQWREGVDGMTRLYNPVATAFDVECNDMCFVPIVPSP